jgi:hypothetical protein
LKWHPAHHGSFSFRLVTMQLPQVPRFVSR